MEKYLDRKKVLALAKKIAKLDAPHAEIFENDGWTVILKMKQYRISKKDYPSFMTMLELG